MRTSPIVPPIYRLGVRRAGIGVNINSLEGTPSDSSRITKRFSLIIYAKNMFCAPIQTFPFLSQARLDTLLNKLVCIFSVFPVCLLQKSSPKLLPIQKLPLSSRQADVKSSPSFILTNEDSSLVLKFSLNRLLVPIRYRCVSSE